MVVKIVLTLALGAGIGSVLSAAPAEGRLGFVFGALSMYVLTLIWRRR